MWNLFLGITGGSDWADYVTPLAGINSQYEWIIRIVFMVYISFTVFCVLILGLTTHPYCKKKYRPSIFYIS